MTRKPNMLGKIVRVRWIDSVTGQGWRWIGESRQTMKGTECDSIGWVVVWNDELVTLVQQVSALGNVSERTTIPWRCIDWWEEFQDHYPVIDIADAMEIVE